MVTERRCVESHPFDVSFIIVVHINAGLSFIRTSWKYTALFVCTVEQGCMGCRFLTRHTHTSLLDFSVNIYLPTINGTIDDVPLPLRL
jgi:hypothetical protein